MHKFSLSFYRKQGNNDRKMQAGLLGVNGNKTFVRRKENERIIYPKIEDCD